MTTTAGPRGEDGEILAVVPVLRRIAEARLRDPDVIEDVVQETVTRLMEVRARLQPSSLVTYSAITIRNLIVTMERQEDRERRHAYRLIDLREFPRPEEVAIREEEREAIAKALARLATRDRKALIAHEVGGATTVEVARQLGAQPGAIAVRLARARARLRLEYLLALRRVTLPTRRCRAVLISLSAGDKRRQAATDAGRHLLDCATCASLSAPLMQRRRPLALLLPLPLLRRAAEYLRSGPQAAKARWFASGTGVIVGAVIVAAVAGGGSEPDAKLWVQGTAVRPSEVATLHEYAGERVTGEQISVQSVPSDEGFWVGTGSENRVWVHIETSGESRFRVAAGKTVDITGRIVSHTPAFPERMGVQPGEGRAVLGKQDQHIEVLGRNVRLSQPAQHESD